MRMAKQEVKPDVFDYSDFRQFLRDIQVFRKSENRAFSHRYISRQVGATSSGWFSNIITGRATLTGTYLVRLSKLLGLKAHERDYFDGLVRFEQAGSVDEKNAWMERLVGMKGVKPTVISREQFAFFSHWYIPAIRELLLVLDFHGDYEDLARRPYPPIKANQAAEAITVLRFLGFIHRDKHGRVRPTEETVRKDSRFATFHWAKLMRAKIDLAREAIERYPRDERDISEVYAPLSDEGYAEMRNEIAKLRRKMLALSQRDKNRNRVWQCNVNFFPLSETIEENMRVAEGTP